MAARLLIFKQAGDMIDILGPTLSCAKIIFPVLEVHLGQKLLYGPTDDADQAVKLL